MRARSWLESLGIALVLCWSPSGRSVAATLDSAWQGEWFFARGESEGGFLSVRDCLPDQKLCRLIFDTHGRSAEDASKVGMCSYGNPKRPTSEENLRVLKVDGKKATARLRTSWGDKACDLQLELDDGKQPPQITARLDGRECDYWCHGYTHLPSTFTLRSRKPYLQFDTYRKVYVCYEDDSRAIREWCTDEGIFALFQSWKLRQRQIDANTGVSKDQEETQWQEGLLEKCRAASNPGRCLAEGYTQRIRELDAQVYRRFLEQKVSAEQVLTAIFPKLDPRTAKTGRQTDVNTKFASDDKKGKLLDELVVLFKIAEPPFLPGHLLVLDIVSDDFEGYQATASFSLLKAEAGRLKLVAREPILAGSLPSDPALLTWRGERSGTNLKFDLANYKINDRERAFGYRVATWDGGTGADYGSESLVLYRLVPEGMKRVLNVTMGSHDASWDNQEGKTYQDKQERFILIVSPNQHEGNYDWLIKGRIINKRIKRSRAAKTQTYVWRNGEYVLESGEASE